MTSGGAAVVDAPRRVRETLVVANPAVGNLAVEKLVVQAREEQLKVGLAGNASRTQDFLRRASNRLFVPANAFERSAASNLPADRPRDRRRLSLHHGVSRSRSDSASPDRSSEGGAIAAGAPAAAQGSQNAVEGGPPAPVWRSCRRCAQRIAAHPDDDVALTQLADMYLAANHFARPFRSTSARYAPTRRTSRPRPVSRKLATASATSEPVHFVRHGRHGRRLLVEAVRPERRARISGLSGAS